MTDTLSFYNVFTDTLLKESLFLNTAIKTSGVIQNDSPQITVEEVSGLEGDLLPYRLSTDNSITGILFLCFFLTAYVLTNGKKMMLQQIKDYLHVKERGSLFAESTGVDLRYRLLLLFQTCILLGVCIFDYFHDHGALVNSPYPSYVLIGIYILCCTVFYTLKWWIYSFLSWIFIDKTKGQILIDSYFFIISYLGLFLFPIALLAVYFDLTSVILIPLAVSIIILAKLLMLYKCIKLFFDNLYGLLPIILYFCALELMPCFILYQALIQINNLFLIKI